MKIVCKLFGSPNITEDENTVYIPSGKVSGVLYYILLKKVVTRDELAGLFWPGSSETNAKISLRNALHKIRRCFKEEIILSPNKSTLALNDDIDIYIDVEEFEKDPYGKINLYGGEFLQGVYLKDNVDFEYWMIDYRSHYNNLYINSLESKIEKEFGQNDNLENYIRNLLSVDSFNETALVHLLKHYEKLGRNDKVINEYFHIQKL